MHPELSLVLLTVLAGAGQGIFILLVALDILFGGTGAVSSTYIYISGIISVALQMAGIAASTSHLGNPQRGWRAMLMVRLSWLSREVVTLSFSVAFVLIYLHMFYHGYSSEFRIAIGILGILANIGFYISSSMVYGSISFIKEWANAYTPFNFIVLGVTSGFGASLAILHYTQTGLNIISAVNYILIALTSLSLIMKSLSYRFNAQAYVSVNLKNAVGVNDPNIRLMDMGTSYDHYNTKEYFHPFSKESNSISKAMVLITAFVLPLIIWSITALDLTGSLNIIMSIIAAVSMIAGLILERRLFFIQGNNIQNLYYANFRSTGARNPIVRKARKGNPVPTG